MPHHRTVNDGGAFLWEESHVAKVLKARAAAAEEAITDEHRRGEAAVVLMLRQPGAEVRARRRGVIFSYKSCDLYQLARAAVFLQRLNHASLGLRDEVLVE